MLLAVIGGEIRKSSWNATMIRRRRAQRAFTRWTIVLRGRRQNQANRWAVRAVRHARGLRDSATGRSCVSDLDYGALRRYSEEQENRELLISPAMGFELGACSLRYDKRSDLLWRVDFPTSTVTGGYFGPEW